jgi:hypothetical protein
MTPAPPASLSPMPVASGSRVARCRAVAVLMALMSVVWAGAWWFAAPSASAEPVAVTEAPALEWGFKLSWRQYAGVPDLSGGATQVAESSIAGYDVAWAFDSGSYDADTRTTVLRHKGSARWHSHPSSGFPPPPGYTGPTDIDLLDLTLTDPVVTISAERATISAEARSRDLNTWEIVDYGRIDVADLAADAATPTVADGTTTWSGIPATMAAQASPVFGGTYYPPGVAVDVVGFSYTGPGGAPDF